MRVAPLFILLVLCLPLEAGFIADVGAVAHYWPRDAHDSCQHVVNALPGDPVDLDCRATAYGASSFSHATGNIYHVHLEARVDHDSIGPWFVAAYASLTFSDSLVILGGVGEAELWGGWSLSGQGGTRTATAVSVASHGRAPYPLRSESPLPMGYEIFAVAGSDGPSRASNDADLSFQVYDASGNRVDAQFYSAEFGRLFAPDQFVPEPSPGISVASAILLLSFAMAVRARS